MIYKGKVTCLNIIENDIDNNRIEQILCLGDMGYQIKFQKIHQALYRKPNNIFQQDIKKNKTPVW